MTKSPAKTRCFWCDGIPEFEPYHDTEWGFPVSDDNWLFEKLTLEGFQSGLSWRTILNKRENFRTAFKHFEIELVAKFGERDIERLLGDAGIVRHRGKIEAAINNAQRALEVIEEFGSLAAYIWRFEPSVSSRPQQLTADTLKCLTTCDEAIVLSKDLKKRGWKFVGPTTVYAFMQAMGLVNDHTDDCFARRKAVAARKKFVAPTA
ncbi:MAG: DNA-3-methyladenine glycosylase I [Planctomycetaceae bacterium]|nr:DNA-3-methyladenine glycosylase I [Planctomycetaceae bacterium]MCB9949887.1 DNA-3-methyladenine glycosylase I [Planctomycetaceae bacterium]